MSRLACLLLLLLLTLPALSDTLDGRNVILVVTEHRTDEVSERLHSKLNTYRNQLGFNRESMPLVFMGFADSDDERSFFERLGFTAKNAPVVGLAEWGNPARFGPKRIYPDAIYRNAHGLKAEHAAAAVLRSWLRLEGHESLIPTLDKLVGTDLGQGQLEIEDTRFEANGAPIYLLNSRVRFKNTGVAVATDITIHFWCRPMGDPQWTLIGERTIERLPAGHRVARDLVVDTKDLPILDENGVVKPCEYRIVITHKGKEISREGEFHPSCIGDH